MNRRLVLMRHAKSSWKTDAPTDHARPLNKRGRKAAPLVAAALSKMRWRPQLIVSSDSVRTRETAERMALGVEAVFLRDLYHAGPEAVAPVLGALDDEVRDILLLGHNPGWEEVLTWLSGSDEELKTGCAALLERDAPTWRDAAGPGWKLRAMLRPREL